MGRFVIALILVCIGSIVNEGVIFAQENSGGIFKEANLMHNNPECKVYKRDKARGLSGDEKVRLCKVCFELGNEETEPIESETIDANRNADQDPAKVILDSLSEEVRKIKATYQEEVERNRAFTTVDANQYAGDPDFSAIKESLRYVKRVCVAYNRGLDSLMAVVDVVIKSSNSPIIGQVYKSMFSAGGEYAVLFDSLTAAELRQYTAVEKLVDLLATSKGKWKVVDGQFSFSDKRLSKKIGQAIEAIESSKERIAQITEEFNSVAEKQLESSLNALKTETEAHAETDDSEIEPYDSETEAYKEVMKLYSSLERFVKGMNKVNADYDSAWARSNFENVLTPERLVADSSFEETKEMFRMLRNALKEKTQGIERLFTDIDESIKTAGLSDKNANTIGEAYQNAWGTVRPWFDSLCVLDSQYFDVVEQIAQVYHEERGNWELAEDGSAMFDEVALRRIQVLRDHLNKIEGQKSDLVKRINEAKRSKNGDSRE